MTAKKAAARKRPSRAKKDPIEAGLSKLADAAGDAKTPSGVALPPANFGLVFTHLQGGQVVLGVAGPSFSIFRSKREATDWLRGFTRAVEDSYPSY